LKAIKPIPRAKRESPDIPVELRMKMSGHADLKSHTEYTHTETQQLANALKRVQFNG